MVQPIVKNPIEKLQKKKKKEKRNTRVGSNILNYRVTLYDIPISRG